VNLTLSPHSGNKTQAADSYETLVTGYQTIWHHIPEDTNCNSKSSLYYWHHSTTPVIVSRVQ